MVDFVLNYIRDFFQSAVLCAVLLFQMSNRGVLALDSAACRTQEKLDIFAIAYARVVDHPHRCAWDVFLVESQVAKFTSGMQQIVESVCGSQGFRLHTYQSTSNLNGVIL